MADAYVHVELVDPELHDPDCRKEVYDIHGKSIDTLLNRVDIVTRKLDSLIERVEKLERVMLLASNIVPGLKSKEPQLNS